MSNILKQNEMLPKYLTRILGKDTEQLENEDVYNFVKVAFASTASR